MAELVDALDSKSSSFGVGVRFPPGVHITFQALHNLCEVLFLWNVANKYGKQWQTFFNLGEIMTKDKELQIYAKLMNRSINLDVFQIVNAGCRQ